MPPKISICIPAYEMANKGEQYLQILLNSINAQTFKDFDICLSDHTVEGTFKKFIDQYPFKIHYSHYKEKHRNGPANTNNAMSLATGDNIKIMFQDDYFCDNNALNLLMNRKQQTNNKVILCGFNHTNESGGYITKYMNPQIISNVPDIHRYFSPCFNCGCPSILFFENHINKPLFDENLVLWMDYEYYYQLYKFYGDTDTLNNYIVTVREWNGRISDRLSEWEVNSEKEIEYIKNKHK